MELKESVLIGRPVEEVFEAWAQVDRASHWDPASIDRHQLGDGAVGKGSRFRAVDRWPLGEVEYTIEITAFERPERIAATWSDPMSGGWDAIFEQHGEATEMRYHATLSPSGLTGLWMRLLKPWYRRQVHAFLESFRDDLGREPTSDD